MSTLDDFNYIGDVSLEYGGKFVNPDPSDWRYGFCDALRVTDAGEVWLVEHITVLVDADHIRQARASGCIPSPLPGRDGATRRSWIASGLVDYGSYDPDDGWDNYRTHHRLLIAPSDYDPDDRHEWPDPDHVLGEDESLLDWLLDNGHLSDF